MSSRKNKVLPDSMIAMQEMAAKKRAEQDAALAPVVPPVAESLIERNFKKSLEVSTEEYSTPAELDDEV